MQKFIVVSHVTTALMLLGFASGQQTPAATKPSQASSQSGAAKSSSSRKSPAASATTGLTLKTQKDKASYALGMSIGSGLQKQGVGVDPAIVSRGLRDAMSGKKTLLTEDEMKTALQQLRADVQQQQQAKAHAAGEANRKAGEAFLAANKAKDGVKTLPDGLEYKVLQEGTGPKPTANDTVTVNYRGTLVDGKEFDSSYKRGQPVSFPVGGVIKGWTEALQLMPVGSKWQLFIPTDLAYGDRPPSPDIGPGATLIFEVELLSIANQKTQ
jgi:FKBP-type peptidyl-prolyl cis-trans isomerase FklB